MLTSEQCIVPNLLAKGLRIVFCGTAPSEESAEQLGYYAYPQNKFWQVLVDIGLTPFKIRPREYARLLEVDIGLTDLYKYYRGNDDKLPQADKMILKANIERYQPAIVAFTSKNAGKMYCGSTAGYGLQQSRVGVTKLFVLPSTSPRAHWAWEPKWWQELARMAPPFSHV
jgi:TDG/mug DNA glycosylase family protein